MNLMTLTDAQQRFLETRRVGHLATADGDGVPHVTPVCYAVADANLYITIDDKPKRQQEPSQRWPLKRLRNIAENPAVTFVVDHYDDRNWSRLCWLMLRGRANILADGPEHGEAQKLLRARYISWAKWPLNATRSSPSGSPAPPVGAPWTWATQVSERQVDGGHG